MSTTTTSLLEITPDEYIERPMRDVNRAPTTFLSIADAMAVPSGNGDLVNIPYPEDITVPSSTKSENAEFDLVEQTAAEAQITAGTVGFTYRISSELRNDALYSAVEMAVRTGTGALMNRIDTDGLSLFSSLSNAGGTANVDLTEAIAIDEMFDYTAQNPMLTSRGIFFVINTVMAKNWATDVTGSNGGNWTSGNTESERIARQLTPGSGFKGERLGMAIFVTSNCPTFNAGADVYGAIGAIGAGGALGYRSWRPITVEDEYFPRRQCWELTISARYGTGVIRDAEARSVAADN